METNHATESNVAVNLDAFFADFDLPDPPKEVETKDERRVFPVSLHKGQCYTGKFLNNGAYRALRTLGVIGKDEKGRTLIPSLDKLNEKSTSYRFVITANDAEGKPLMPFLANPELSKRKVKRAMAAKAVKKPKVVKSLTLDVEKCASETSEGGESRAYTALKLVSGSETGLMAKIMAMGVQSYVDTLSFSEKRVLANVFDASGVPTLK